MARAKKRPPFVLPPGIGRLYVMGPVRAVFRADGAQTLGKYSVSEWTFDPFTRGRGKRTSEADGVFIVTEGTMSFFLEGAWTDVPKDALVMSPGGTPYDFENRSAAPATLLQLAVPGDFEAEMEELAEWFRARSPAEARTSNAPRSK